MNILNNAIDALDVSELSHISPMIHISTEQINNKILIKIKDNGIGISESLKSKVFDPFFTTKPIGSGTGLGLSVCYQIVTTNHSGSILFDSIPDMGTELCIEIPVKQKAKT